MKILENLNNSDYISKMYGKLSNHSHPRTVVETLLMVEDEFGVSFPQDVLEFLEELNEKLPISDTSENSRRMLKEIGEKYLEK